MLLTGRDSWGELTCVASWFGLRTVSWLLTADLKLPTYSGNKVNFQDVVHGCAKRVIKNAASKEGKEFEDLPADHAVTRTVVAHRTIVRRVL